MFFCEIGPTRNSGHEPHDAEYVTISTVHSRRRNSGAGLSSSASVCHHLLYPTYIFPLCRLPSPRPRMLCNHRGKINNPGTRARVEGKYRFRRLAENFLIGDVPRKKELVRTLGEGVTARAPKYALSEIRLRNLTRAKYLSRRAKGATRIGSLGSDSKAD